MSQWLTVVHLEDAVCEPERDVGEEDEEPGGQDQVLHVGHRPRGEGGHRVHHRQESEHGWY